MNDELKKQLEEMGLSEEEIQALAKAGLETEADMPYLDEDTLKGALRPVKFNRLKAELLVQVSVEVEETEDHEEAPGEYRSPYYNDGQGHGGAGDETTQGGALHWAKRARVSFADDTATSRFARLMRVIGLLPMDLMSWVDKRMTDLYVINDTELRDSLEDWKYARAEGTGTFSYKGKRIRVVSSALRSETTAAAIDRLASLSSLDEALEQLSRLHTQADNKGLFEGFGLRAEGVTTGTTMTASDMLRRITATQEVVTEFNSGIQLAVLNYLAEEVEFVLDAVLGFEEVIRAMRIPFRNSPMQSVVEQLRIDGLADLRASFALSEAAYNLFVSLDDNPAEPNAYLVGLAPKAKAYLDASREFGMKLDPQSEVRGGLSGLRVLLKVKIGGLTIEVAAEVGGTTKAALWEGKTFRWPSYDSIMEKDRRGRLVEILQQLPAFKEGREAFASQAVGGYKGSSVLEGQWNLSGPINVAASNLINVTQKYGSLAVGVPALEKVVQLMIQKSGFDIATELVELCYK